MKMESAVENNSLKVSLGEIIVSRNFRKVLRGHDDMVTALDWIIITSSIIIISAGKDGRVKLWNGISGNLLYSANAHENEISCISARKEKGLAPLFATAGKDKIVKLWLLNIGSLVSFSLIQTFSGHNNSLKIYKAI
jgi:WD40 repeat protein